jgi:CBS-domain-containing membrane protein
MLRSARLVGKPLDCRGTDPRLRTMQITDVDLELLRLEEVLRVARERLAGIIRMVPDPAVLKAAEDLCAKAIAALAAYRAGLGGPVSRASAPG